MQVLDDPREVVVRRRRGFRLAGDDQRRPRLVDQDRVDLVDDREGVAALDEPVLRDGHVVAQVVEAELGVGAVRDVRRVGLSALGERHHVLDRSDRRAETFEDGPVPLGVALGEVVVRGDEVDARAGERVQVERGGGDERLALTGLHLGDVALVQDDRAHHLDVEHPLLRLAPARLADGCVGVEDELVERLAVLEPFAEPSGGASQLLVGERLQLGLERGDVRRLLREPLQPAPFADAENFLELAHAGSRHRHRVAVRLFLHPAFTADLQERASVRGDAPDPLARARPRVRFGGRSSDGARAAGRRPALERGRRRRRSLLRGRVHARLPRGAALECRHPQRSAAREPLLRQHEYRQRRRGRDRHAGPRAVADVHGRQHPRVVALDERRGGEGATDRVPPGRRRRAAAGHPRQRLGRVAALRHGADDRRARSQRVAPLHLHRGGPGRLSERPLARLRGGAREWERVDILAGRQADPGAAVRARGRAERRSRRPRPDRRDRGRAGDPRRRRRADGPAACRRPLPRLLGGNRRLRHRTRAAAAPARKRQATGSSVGSSRASTHSSAAAGSPTGPDARSASASGRSSAAPSRSERPGPRTGRRRGAGR